MLRFVLGRAVALAGTVFLAALAVFLLLTVIPGDAARLVVGPEATPEAYARARDALGLDRPWPARFADWLGRAVRGDFGRSWAYPWPVGELLSSALSITLPLALLAIAVASVLGLGAGLLAASHLRRRVDLGLMALSQIGVAVPEFWVGILLIGWLAVGWRTFPSGGFPGWGDPRALSHLVLPALALALPRGAYLARMVRATVADVLARDHIRTARAKGLPERRVLLHALRGALVPVTAAFGLTFARLLAGTLVVENVFALPGLGWYAVRAASGRDLVLLLGIAVVTAAMVGVVSTLADLGYALLNPRIRHR
ncbi:TPA: peptide ABC transporter [Candidatus Acetothermia bacterium]|nr:peptide ABC transporter [Candidatus Acetothermia bacterium]